MQAILGYLGVFQAIEGETNMNTRNIYDIDEINSSNLANWMRERGIRSAQRIAQTDGEIPVEDLWVVDDTSKSGIRDLEIFVSDSGVRIPQLGVGVWEAKKWLSSE